VSVLLGNGDGTFQNQVTYAVGSSPVALVAGDFNGDGRTDLAVADYGSLDDNGNPISGSSVSVLLGNGDGTFQNQVTYAVETGPVALVAADFNDDGRTDLAVANLFNSVVSVLLGNGDGTFQNEVPYTVGSYPLALVAGEFNGDGRTDLAVANANSNDVSVLLGNGDGTFQNQVPYAVGSSPADLVAGDFNGDGRTDLAVANAFSNTVSVLLGNGDGTFQNQVTYAVGSGPVALVAGDFNGDGRTDLAVANYDDSDMSVLLGNGDGTFQHQLTYPVGSSPVALVAGDFNGDGRTDLAVTNAGSLDSHGNLIPGTSTVSVLLGNGDGTFQHQVTYAVGNAPSALVAGDFNGDGRTDLAVANADSNTVSVLLGNGDGTFENQVTYAVGNGPAALVAGDFNGDGRTDLAVANYDDNDVSVMLSLNGTLTAPGPQVTTPQASPIVADLSGDGTLDAFAINAAGDILWRRGRPDEPGSYDSPIAINPGHPARDIVAVDTNQGPVLASVDATDNAISLYAWRGGAFALIGSLPTGSLPAQIVAGDLFGDSADDLVVRNAGDGTLSIYINTNNQSGPTTSLPPPFEPPITVPVGPGISDVTLADVSGDGRMDILVTDKLTGEVGVISTLGPVVLAPPVLYPAGTGLYAVTNASDPATVTSLEATTGVAAAPLTTGGPDDLVVIDSGSNTASVLRGLGDGRFANPLTVPTSSPAIQVLLADLEGNGVRDMIVLSNQGVSVDRGDGQGGFLPKPFTIPAGPEPTGVTLADVNHDGKLDLLVGNAYGDLLVLLGNGNGTFQPYHNANQNVALAVLPNGDSQPDFIFADQGLDKVVDYSGGTSKTLADHTSGLLAPGAVALADLNGDGIPDLIVADSGSNNVLVYPGLGNGQFGPELNGGHGFFTGTNPVSITVANLNGRPDLVVANEGSNDVSILLNQATASGGFTFVPGPRLQAGLGPVATVVQDVNGDGIPDLLVSDSGSNQVLLLPGVGGGFFNDANPSTIPAGTPPGPLVTPTIIPVGTTPGPLLVGNFTGRPGQLDLVTLDTGSNDLSLVRDLNGGNTFATSISSGGEFPIAAVAGAFGPAGGNGTDLLVANNGDGRFALFLSGADGLELAHTFDEPDLPNPTALATDPGGAIYGATEGVDHAVPVILGFGPGSGTPVLPIGPNEQQVVTMQPLSPMSLPVIATAFSLPGEPESQSSGSGNGAEGVALVAAAIGTTTFATSEVPAAQASGAATQGGAVPAALPNQALRKEGGAGGPGGGEPEAAAIEGAGKQAEAQPQTAAPPTTVVHFIAGVDDFVARARLWTILGTLWDPLTRAEGRPSLPHRLGALLARWSPVVASLGSPALTRVIDLTRAALTAAGHDPSAGDGDGDGGDDPEAARPAASSPSDHPSIEASMAAVPSSPLEFVAASIGLGSVAWAHVRRRPRRNRQPVRVRREFGSGVVRSAGCDPPEPPNEPEREKNPNPGKKTGLFLNRDRPRKKK
jgi:hypothetical protein